MTNEQLKELVADKTEIDLLRANKTIAAQAAQIKELEAESLEDARIIGMSGEREAKHIAIIECQAEQIKVAREAFQMIRQLKKDESMWLLDLPKTADDAIAKLGD